MSGLGRGPHGDALRDATIEPYALHEQRAAATAQALLRAHVLGRISDALSASPHAALLVKGAGLALTVYREPAARPMSDIDLLVREEDREAIIAALVNRGGEVAGHEGREESAAFFAETVVTLRSGGVRHAVEVHTTLDKIVRHPVDLEGIFARACPCSTLPGLWTPSVEDHTLLVALHAAGHEFRHELAWLDLELLFRRGLDLDILAARAHAWGLRSVMYAALRGLLALGAASIDARILARFDPGPIRRWVIGRIVPNPHEQTMGGRWLLRQAVFHDDLGAWGRDAGRYAAVRGRERGRESLRFFLRELRRPMPRP